MGAVVVLVLITCSQAMLMLEFVAHDVIGPDYTSGRFAYILVNLGLMVVATGAALVIRRGQRRILVSSGVWVGLAWLYMAAVSSMV